MTNDERKRQRELFEAAVVKQLPHLPLGLDEHGDYAAWLPMSLFAIWQAACEANGVGEPPADDERDEIEKRLEAFSNLHSACSNLASKLDGMEWDNDEVNRFRLLFAPIRRVLYKVAAALAKREDGVPQTVLTANAKPLFEFDERSFVDLEELKRRGFVCRIATVAVSNPETGEEKILMLPLGEE